uniref:Uncharacterized protein n=1 Tax=Poecilia formosa TaxID=48698 RepID=A0A096LVF0_POEFO
VSPYRNISDNNYLKITRWHLIIIRYYLIILSHYNEISCLFNCPASQRCTLKRLKMNREQTDLFTRLITLQHTIKHFIL